MPRRISPEALEGMRQTAALKAESKAAKEKRIVRLALSGERVVQISRAVGCSREFVRTVLARHAAEKIDRPLDSP